MKQYLGVNYIYDDVFKIYISGKGNYLDLESMKQGIRKLSLPTYQPTKTLNWLKEKTGLEWIYNNEYKTLCAKGVQDGEVYDFKDNTAFLGLNCDIIVDPYNEDGTWFDISPRVFIEKIEKGEVIL